MKSIIKKESADDYTRKRFDEESSTNKNSCEDLRRKERIESSRNLGTEVQGSKWNIR